MRFGFIGQASATWRSCPDTALMHIKELHGKRICILGFGREGKATLKALEQYAPDTDVTIADREEQTEIRNPKSEIKIQFQTGKNYADHLDTFDVVIKSPGIPPSELRQATYNLQPTTYHLTSATQIFFDSIADTGATVIGVTGSKGKSTTASLIYSILHATATTYNLQPTTYLIGNIGTPALDFLDKAKPGVTFVMELSSYQLMDITVSPHIAVITSFFPEHLDYHGSLDAYKKAKQHICRFQRKTDIVFYPSQQTTSPHPALSRGERVKRATASEGEGEGADAIAMLSPGKKIPYSEKDAPVKIDETKLIGHHNLRNIAAAWKVTEHCGISRAIAIQAIRAFQPLPHRLQSLGIHHGIEWVDDAISTTPESTIAALDALGERVTTIILGGLDRGYDFTELTKRIACSSIQAVILLTTESSPGSAPRIRAALEATGINVQCFAAQNMKEAIQFTKTHTPLPPTPYHLPPICLLSTASSSYTMFKNFEEKGDCFRKAINTITTTP